MKCKGFVLLELLIALFVIEIVLVAFFKYMTTEKYKVKRERYKIMLVQSVANKMEEIKIERDFYKDFEDEKYGKYRVGFDVETRIVERGFISTEIRGKIEELKIRYKIKRYFFEKGLYTN